MSNNKQKDKVFRGINGTETVPTNSYEKRLSCVRFSSWTELSGRSKLSMLNISSTYVAAVEHACFSFNMSTFILKKSTCSPVIQSNNTNRKKTTKKQYNDK